MAAQMALIPGITGDPVSSICRGEPDRLWRWRDEQYGHVYNNTEHTEHTEHHNDLTGHPQCPDLAG
jgi:hypothetical protein